MAVTWTILSTEANVSTGEITKLHWEASDYEIQQSGAREILHRGRRYGEAEIESDPTSENYIDWENVTKEIALNWVKTFLGADEVAKIEGYIADDIAKSKAPVVRQENPWEMGDEE